LGDEGFINEDLDEAEKHYTRALEVEEKNEYALANLSLISMKR